MSLLGISIPSMLPSSSLPLSVRDTKRSDPRSFPLPLLSKTYSPLAFSAFSFPVSSNLSPCTSQAPSSPFSVSRRCPLPLLEKMNYEVIVLPRGDLGFWVWVTSLAGNVISSACEGLQRLLRSDGLAASKQQDIAI